MKTLSISHGSSLTAELLGDMGTFTAASDVLKDSEEWGVPLCLRPLLLGDNGTGDSLLCKEMCNEGLSNRATMERIVKNCTCQKWQGTNCKEGWKKSRIFKTF